MTPPPSVLSDPQIQSYWRDGFVSGIPVLTPDETSIARQALIGLEATELEQDPKRWSNPDYQPWKQRGSPWWNWFQGLVRHPTIIDAVSSVLGPDVLLRNADIFVKPVDSSTGINWHTDTTAGNADADTMLTAWLAISSSTRRNGCMEWLPGSHRAPLPPEAKDKHSLTFDPESTEAANAADRRANILKPGELSLHHFRTTHRSRRNQTSRPRIGLAMRFMASNTPPAVAESGKATLIAGSNLPGHFELEDSFRVGWSRTEAAQLTPPRRWWNFFRWPS